MANPEKPVTPSQYGAVLMDCAWTREETAMANASAMALVVRKMFRCSFGAVAVISIPEYIEFLPRGKQKDAKWQLALCADLGENRCVD